MKNKKMPYIIAEIGFNHAGDVRTAKKLIREAKAAGADAVKFQSFAAEDILLPNSPYFRKLKKAELSFRHHKLLADFARKKKIDFISTAYSMKAVDLLEEIKVKAHKVASMDLNNFELLERVAKTKKPIFVSTGMATLEEIKKSVNLLRRLKSGPVTLLHCISKYPTKPEEANLDFLAKIRQSCKCPVGYSDHTRGIFTCFLSAILGAAVIEKHFTLDNSLKGADHYHSAEPAQLKELINQIRLAFSAIGDSGNFNKRPDRKFAGLFRRGIYARTDIHRGAIISRKDLLLCRPEKHLSAFDIIKIICKKAKKEIKKFEPLEELDF